MSCGASSTCCVPPPQGKSNLLGFVGSVPCCSYPCISFPPIKVNICLRINAQTQATIQQGCKTSCQVSGTDQTCNLVFRGGAIQDSWGKSCRTIYYSEFVTSGAYIRIRLTAVDGCSNACSTYSTSPAYTDACTPSNALLKFTAGGVDYVSTIQGQAQGDGTLGCLVKAACIGNASTSGFDATQGTCCQWYTLPQTSTQVVSWGLGVVNTGYFTGGGVADLPIGTEIVVGPITVY